MNLIIPTEDRSGGERSAGKSVKSQRVDDIRCGLYVLLIFCVIFNKFAMDKYNEMQLMVWEGDYGLISMNVQCVQVILYAKIAKVPLEISYNKNPYCSLHWDYPIFKHGDIVLNKVDDIINYMRNEKYGADFNLTKKLCSDSYAYTNMLQMKLKPVIDFLFWGDKRNFEEFTRVWYAKAMWVPFNYFYPSQLRQNVLDLIKALYPIEDNLELIHNYMMSDACKVLSLLCNHLGKNNYFMGKSPSTVDAYIYSYLAPLQKIPFPSKQIPNFLQSYPKLIEYIKRLDTEFFPNLPNTSKYLPREEVLKKPGEDEITTSLRTKIVTFSLVCAIMFGYAASNNIIDTSRVRRFLTQ